MCNLITIGISWNKRQFDFNSMIKVFCLVWFLLHRRYGKWAKNGSKRKHFSSRRQPTFGGKWSTMRASGVKLNRSHIPLSINCNFSWCYTDSCLDAIEFFLKKQVICWKSKGCSIRSDFLSAKLFLSARNGNLWLIKEEWSTEIKTLELLLID